VKGEDSVDEIISSLQAQLESVAGTLQAADPDMFDRLRAENPVLASFFARNTLDPLAAFISKGGLQDFAKKNFKKLLNADEVGTFADLSTREAQFLDGVLREIAGGLDQDAALELCGEWDGKEPWAAVIERFVEDQVGED
jgi:hypothetical protein